MAVGTRAPEIGSRVIFSIPMGDVDSLCIELTTVGGLVQEITLDSPSSTFFPPSKALFVISDVVE